MAYEYIKLCFILVVVCLLQKGQSLKLPSYITPCKRDAIDLLECAKRNGQEAIPEIVKGDPKYRIPNMLPFKIPHVSFNARGNLKITVTDAEIHGLENIVIKDVKADMNNQHLRFVLYLPKAALIGNYDVKGRILVLPISGSGPANITLIGGTFIYDTDYELKERKGEEYMVITKSNINYETKRLYFQLDNLFNGNKLLGEEMNKFLNENWREVSEDVGPALTETISQIATSILSTITQRVPYNEIFA